MVLVGFLRAVKPVEIEALWRQFFEDPSQWSDVRTQKVPHSVPLNFVLELPDIIPNFVPHLKLQVTRVFHLGSVLIHTLQGLISQH